MGIQYWTLREPAAQDSVTAQTPPAPAHDPAPPAARDAPPPPASQAVHAQPLAEQPVVAEPVPPADTDNLDLIHAEVARCTACGLHESRTRTVPGVGVAQTDWLVVGEAPGAEEDRRGEPFVGRGGKLLDAMLFSLGLDRRTLYITNIVKCRPPNNRDPATEEAEACAGYLQRQIAVLQPKIMLAVGRVAAQRLLGVETPVGRLRGQVHRHSSGVPVVVTYHPAYLLRSPLEKRKAWADLQLAARVLAEQRAQAGADD